MATRVDLLASIAETISDYREGEVPRRNPKHIETWVSQFDHVVQEPLLAELDHVLDRTYIPRATFDEFVASLLVNEKLVRPDPEAFWKRVEFLQIQGGGNSQREILQLFDAVLARECGFGITDCGAEPDAFVYLDDVVFTGNRVLSDIRTWLQGDAPKKSTLHVITMALHTGAEWYASERIAQAATAAGKTIDIHWWRSLTIEDQRINTNSSDVLRPTVLPDDEAVRAYAEALKYPPTLRLPGNLGKNKFFSSEAGRHLLEQEFLKAGVRIREMCPGLNEYQRPLGNMVLQTLGFGTTIVTFRNCPNNAPLAFWAGDPWYPLFPRSTNSAVFMKRLLESHQHKKAGPG